MRNLKPAPQTTEISNAGNSFAEYYRSLAHTIHSQEEPCQTSPYPSTLEHTAKQGFGPPRTTPRSPPSSAASSNPIFNTSVSVFEILRGPYPPTIPSETLRLQGCEAVTIWPPDAWPAHWFSSQPAKKRLCPIHRGFIAMSGPSAKRLYGKNCAPFIAALSR